MDLYSHVSPVEEGQYWDYALGFLEVSCKVVVILSVMILENFQGFKLACSQLARFP